MIGLTPIFRASDVVAITLDFTYKFNFRQHFNFDGEFAQPDKDYTTGSFFTPSLGVVIYLGSKRRHADWY